MKLTVLGSGSKGNCYLLHNNEECLILEAGVPFSEVRHALKGDIRKVKACLVTHEHGDHIKYAGDMLAHGIRTYMTAGTMKAKQWRHYLPLMLETGIPAVHGRFTVLPFRTVHDAAEPCGFFINHPETGNIVFATDTAYVPNTFKAVTNMLIECNYDPELLAARTDIPESLKDRIRESHQSIDTCIAAIKANMDQGTLHHIVLLHISEGDGDPNNFKIRTMHDTGLITDVATRGLEIDIKQYPF